MVKVTASPLGGSVEDAIAAEKEFLRQLFTAAQ